MLASASVTSILLALTLASLEAADQHRPDGKPARTPVSVSAVLPRDQEVALAVSAAPAHIGRDAAVYVYTAAGYERAREGTNGFTCLVNRDSELDGYQVLKPTCWDRHGSETIVPAILEIAKLRGAGRPVRDVTSTIRARIQAGTLRPFTRTGIAYMLAGDIAEYDPATGITTRRAFPPHVMIYAPGTNAADLGITQASGANPQAPVMYESATGYRYIVIRVPDGR